MAFDESQLPLRVTRGINREPVRITLKEDILESQIEKIIVKEDSISYNLNIFNHNMTILHKYMDIFYRQWCVWLI